MNRRSAITWVATGLACAACGGAVHKAASTATTRTGAVQLPVAPAGGAAVFARDCKSCHSLVGNESLHKQGGDLLGYDMSRAQLLQLTRVMPTRPLTAAQLNAVVDYVLRAEQRHRG